MGVLNLLHLPMSFLAHLLGPLLEAEKERVLAGALAKTQAELRCALERLTEYEARIVALDKELADAREDCERFRNALRVSLDFRSER